MPLTTGIDTPANTAGNDTYDATENSAGNATLTAMDVIDGGAGTDTLKVVDATAIDTAIVGLSVKNVENISLTSGAGVTTNTSTWTGATSLTIAAGDDVAATAAATTNVTVAASALSADNTAAAELSVSGGLNVTVTSADTVAMTAGADDVSQIVIGGATTAPKGAVKVTHTETSTTSGTVATDAATGSAITVTGGTTVEVNSLAVAGTANDALDIQTIGKVIVNGTTDTTAVTVKQTAATTWSATAAKAVIAGGDVDVLDVNRADATKAGTITTVSLDNFAAAVVNSGALTTLNLSGKGASVNAGTLGALTTPANTALAVNVNGLTTTGTVTVDSDIKTLNVAASTAASTINLLTNGATALNISGDAKLTLTGQTAVAKQVITVTNTAGAVLGTALATDAKFTGGAGADSILLAATTKSQDMGAGDDVVTVSVTALGAGGSVNGGAGTDTLVANTNGSNFIADPAFGGFETLRVAGAAAQGSHNANGFSAIEVGVLGGGAATFTSVAANVGLTMLASPTAATTVTLANATGTADVFGLTLKSDGDLTAGSVTVAGVETVNITNTDSLTTTASGINTNTITLVTNAAKTVTVSGNAGLTITNDAGNTAITSFDASAVTGAAADAAALAVTFVSNNATVGAVVTIKGGSGNDSLTGNAANKDVIDGGAGDDTIAYGGGADEFTGGAGADIFDINAVGTSSVYLTIKDATKGDKLDLVGVSGVAIVDAELGAKVSLGDAATLAQYLDAAAATNTGAVAALVKWFQFGGDTYVVVDNSNNTTFTSGTDSVIKLTGTVDLSTSSVATEIITLAA